jgi:hypothetical protein
MIALDGINFDRLTGCGLFLTTRDASFLFTDRTEGDEVVAVGVHTANSSKVVYLWRT